MRRKLCWIVLSCLVTTVYSQTNFQGILPWWHGFFEDTTTTTTRVTPPPSTTAKPLVDPELLISENCYAQPNCDEQFYRKYPLLEGICNNMVDKNRGRINRAFKRLLPPDYGDKIGSPRLDQRGNELPSARLISLELSKAEQLRSFTASQWVPFWGQFMTHDITKTPKGKRDDGAFFNCNCRSPDTKGCHNIPVPKSDIHFQKEKETCLQMERSETIPDVNCNSTIRQQKNAITAFIDASNIYGDSESDLRQLLDRRSTIGELLVGDYGEKGLDAGLATQHQVNRDFAARMSCPLLIHKPPTEPCLMAGDTRVNENVGLSAANLMFVRIHNKIIKKLNSLNPSWSRETLVKETRAIVAALLQRITYKEFLPVLVGEENMKRFKLKVLEKGYWYGYDGSKDASLSNAFATAAFRYGHTTISKSMSRPAPDWFTTEADDIRMKDVFFNNEPLLEQFIGGVNSVLRGLANDASMLTGAKMTHDMTELLFSSQGRPGGDLFATNIQRGRDHGIPPYNKFREFCGMKKVTDFSEIKEISLTTLNRLSSLYRHVDDIDFYIGGLSETPLPGAVVGPTFACIISYQFRELRIADRFWFENAGIFSSFTRGQLDSLREYSLANLMCETMTDLRTIQPLAMLLSTVPGNGRRYCQTYREIDLNPWKITANDNNHSERDNDYEWSAWLPCVSHDGRDISVAQTLNDALIHRPDDICREIVGSEVRTINSINQVRFKCPPGTIRATDFPFIDNGEEVMWTPWFDHSSPGSSGDDDEALDEIPCSRPIAIQAQTTRRIPARETGDVFESYGITNGFVCRGIHQQSRSCQDYRVRYLCRKGELNSLGKKSQKSSQIPTPSPAKKTTTTVSDPNALVWTPWVSNDTPAIEGDRELVENVNTRPGFCRVPLYVEARTVKTHISAQQTGDNLDNFSRTVGLICINNKQISNKRCSDYEVRYLCFNKDIIREDPVIPPDIKRQAKNYCESFGLCC